MKRVLLLLLCLLFIAGCSATEKIASGVNEVRNLAISSESHARNIQAQTQLDGDLTAIAAEADAIVVEQKQIQKVTDKVALQIPKVKDVTPWWATLIKVVTSVIGLVVLVGALWYTGVLSLLAAFLRGFGLLIPHNTLARATLDAKAIVQGTASKLHRESIAASRAGSKAYDSAFRRAKAKEKEKE